MKMLIISEFLEGPRVMIPMHNALKVKNKQKMSLSHSPLR